MKNLKGGYQLVDLEKNDLSSSFTLEGLFETITLSNNKSLLVTGIVIGGTKKNDVYTTYTKSGTSYVFEVYGKTVTVKNTDAVTVADTEKPLYDLYQHVIKMSYSSGGTTFDIVTTVISKDKTAYGSLTNLVDKYCYTNKVTGQNTDLIACGVAKDSSASIIVKFIRPTHYEGSPVAINIYGVKTSDFSTSGSVVVSNPSLTYDEIVYKM